MKSGVFALIDCLGFKGIWKRYNDDYELLMNKLSSIGDRAESAVASRIYPQEIPRDEIAYDVKVKLLSDTVAVSLQSKKTLSVRPVYQLITMIQIINELMDVFIENKPQLVFRGCITYGEHITEKNFLIGPAVDYTAEHMHLAQGAFVWFLPNASMLIDEWIDIKCNEPQQQSEHLKIIFEALSPKYSIPFKNGQSLTLRAINPLFYKSDEQAKSIIQSYKDFMISDNIDIWIKRENTVRFLEYCNKLNSNAREADEQFN